MVEKKIQIVGWWVRCPIYPRQRVKYTITQIGTTVTCDAAADVARGILCKQSPARDVKLCRLDGFTIHRYPISTKPK